MIHCSWFFSLIWRKSFDKLIHVGLSLIARWLGENSRHFLLICLAHCLQTTKCQTANLPISCFTTTMNLVTGCIVLTRLVHSFTGKHFMESSYYFSKNAFNVISILQFARKRVFNTEIICAAAYVSKIYLLYEGTGQVPWNNVVSLAQLSNMETNF